MRPDVPAVTRAFDYLVPEALAPAVRVGAIVRVPLHGRRVRGWVVADRVEPETAVDRLVPLHAVVSAGPPPDVLALCEWAAWRWAGPLTAFLRAASPPNVVNALQPADAASALHPVCSPPPDLGLDAWPDSPLRVVTWAPGADRRGLVQACLAADGSTLVVVPEPARANALVKAVAREGRAVLHHHSDLSDRDRTAVWANARRGAVVVVGGRASVWLPLPDLRAVVVLDEADETLQEERAPTWHARDVALERARRARATATLVSPAPVPGPEVDVARLVPPPRVLRSGWPRIDRLDLRAEPPGTGLCAESLGPSIHRAITGGGRAICVVNRRGRARLLACRSCGVLARCATCGAAVGQPDDALVCPRCEETRPAVCTSCGSIRFRAVRPGVHAARDTVAALVPRVAVAEVDAETPTVGDAPVLVGTEAVLHRVARGASPPVRLVAFLTFDEELLASRYRAHEEALWLLIRAARLLGPRAAGGHLVVQTRLPDHPVLEVAASGDPASFVAAEAEVRRLLRFPPFGGLAELAGAAPAVAAAVDAVRAAGLSVGGAGEGRALVRAPSAAALAERLAQVDFADARAFGRLRVSVDPPRV